MEIKLNEKVKKKLAEAVDLWAEENLIGKPALLANVMFYSLEAAMIKKIKEIHSNDSFSNSVQQRLSAFVLRTTAK